MSKTRMYNAHVCVSGIPAFEEMIKSRLNYIAEAMPLNEQGEGKFWNNHMDGYEDHCPGIVMLGDGKICAIYPRCSLNPLAWNGKEVVLSTWATGGIFGKSNEDWGKSIQHYNESLSEYSGSVAIIGYIIFAEDKNPEYKSEN